MERVIGVVLNYAHKNNTGFWDSDWLLRSTLAERDSDWPKLLIYVNAVFPLPSRLAIGRVLLERLKRPYMAMSELQRLVERRVNHECGPV